MRRQKFLWLCESNRRAGGGLGVNENLTGKRGGIIATLLRLSICNQVCTQSRLLSHYI